jgi:putative membrane protein
MEGISMTRQFLIRASAALAALALGVGVNAVGQTTPATPSPNPDPHANVSRVAADDLKFIAAVAEHNLAEIELGKLAQERAHNADVKEFAARMVRDHGKANDDLKPIADAKGIALPTTPDKSHQRKRDTLAKKSGADFDKAFMKDMVKDHKKDVKEFQKHARSSKDGDVKNYASNALPLLEEHLRLARETEDALKGKTKRSG